MYSVVMKTPFDASAADTFCKLCGKREIAHYEQFLFLSQCCQLFLIIYPYRDFPLFCPDVFKVVCCRAVDLLLCGKWLSERSLIKVGSYMNSYKCDRTIANRIVSKIRLFP